MAAAPPAPASILQSLCEELRGNTLTHITNKILTDSDLQRQQSRLRLSGSSEHAIQLGLHLSLPQQAAANFHDWTDMASMVVAGFITPEDMKRGMALEGVRVVVFVLSPGEPRRRAEGTLVQWNCGSIVIRGGDALRARSQLHVGDVVEVWGFKDEQNNLYFAIYKP